jgi:tRNA uridine 5-carboxymethylaminomethyl modification enzyme
MQEHLFNYPNLTVIAGNVHDILMAHRSMIIGELGKHPIYGEVQGVKLGKRCKEQSLNGKVYNLINYIFHTESGKIIYAPKVILTTGTFLQGEIHIGNM